MRTYCKHDSVPADVEADTAPAKALGGGDWREKVAEKRVFEGTYAPGLGVATAGPGRAVAFTTPQPRANDTATAAGDAGGAGDATVTAPVVAAVDGVEWSPHTTPGWQPSDTLGPPPQPGCGTRGAPGK